MEVEMNNSWTPAELLQLSGGYWSACALHAGVKLDVFTPLAERRHTAKELADLVGADTRGLAMLLDALSAMQLLQKSGPNYSLTPFAAEYLSRTSSKFLGHIILHHHHLMSGWTLLDEAVASGKPMRDRVSHIDDETARESFEMGMFNLAMQIAPSIVTHFDLEGRRSLLDLGGGPGTYAIHFCLQNPGLEAVVYDLPTTRPFAEKVIASFGLENRITFMDGDFINQEIKGSYDVAWLSHILHGEGPADCRLLLDKAVKALKPGGLLLVQEFILNDEKDGPIFPALFSLNMLLGTPDGQAYAEGEIMAMMVAAGLTDVRRIPMDIPNGAGVIAGNRPR
jgi:SAM-dependent methyltransferase